MAFSVKIFISKDGACHWYLCVNIRFTFLFEEFGYIYEAFGSCIYLSLDYSDFHAKINACFGGLKE